MVQMAAREAKNHFGELIDTALQEPVAITKKGRAVVVLLSQQEYARLQAQDEVVWAARADAALQQAEWIGPEASRAAVQELVSDAPA